MQAHSDAYPLGDGPLERLRDGIGIEYSAETAAELARGPDLTATLSEPYLKAYSGAALRLLGDGDWRGALRTQRLAVNAVGAMRDASLEVRAYVVLAWLGVAIGYVREVPDARVFRAATIDGEALLAAARAAEEREIEAGVLLGLGRLAIFPCPFDAPPGLLTSRTKRWFERRDEELGAELEEIEAGSLRIENMDDAIARGDGLLREALAIAEGRQRGLVAHALLRCCDAWAARGAPRSEDEIVELAKIVVNELDSIADVAMVAEAAMHLALHGLVTNDLRIAGLLAIPPQDVRRAVGLATATSAALKVAELRGLSDPDEGLRVIGHARPVLEDAPEIVRLDALRLEISLLIEVELPFALDEVRGLEEAIDKLAKHARRDRWTTERHARAVLLLALSSGTWDEELLGKRAVLKLSETASEIFVEHSGAIAYGLAGLQADWAVRLAREGDRMGAVEKLAMAAGQNLQIGAVDAALEALRMLTSTADLADTELQWAVLVEVSKYVLPHESEVGEAGARVLRKLWAQVVMHLLLGRRPDLNLLCAQLGKGRRFAMALDGRHGYAAREDAEGTELHEQIAALRRSLGDPRRDAWLDEVTLMRPYTERLDALSTLRDGDRLEGLQRTFDARVQSELSRAAAREQPPLLQLPEIRLSRHRCR